MWTRVQVSWGCRLGGDEEGEEALREEQLAQLAQDRLQPRVVHAHAGEQQRAGDADLTRRLLLLAPSPHHTSQRGVNHLPYRLCVRRGNQAGTAAEHRSQRLALAPVIGTV